MKRVFIIPLILLAFSCLLSANAEVFKLTDRFIRHKFSKSHGDIELIFENFIKDYCAIEPSISFNFGKPDKPVYYFEPATYESEKQVENLFRHYLIMSAKINEKSGNNR